MQRGKGVIQNVRKIALLLALSAIIGCAVQGSAKKPEISIANMHFEGLALFQTTVVFDVRIDNENPFPLEIDGGVHRPLY